MTRDDLSFALTGSELSDTEAAELETTVEQNPADVDSRLKLLGYYFTRQYRDTNVAARRVPHIVWLIEHQPESEIVGSPCCRMDRSDPAVAGVCAAWDRALLERADEPEVILRAANFLTHLDRERARSLLERGEQMDPSSTVWARHLGSDLFREVGVAQMGRDRSDEPTLTPFECRELAGRALAHFDRALALAPSPRVRFQLLSHCAEAALECDQWGDASRYADEIVALAPQCTDAFHYLDYLHDAHIARGRVALHVGDLEGARRELDAAGRQGSDQAPVLRSFGPDFRLARLLLEQGETAAVLGYLAQCATFWGAEEECARIARWRDAIERGEVPFMFTGFDPAEHDLSEPT